MSAEIVVATCAVVIALASLGVAVWQAHTTREHNRRSVRPVLQLHRGTHEGALSGIRLTNAGLGPALVVSTHVTLDGELIGRWDKTCADRVRADLPTHLNAVTFGEGEVLPIGYSEYLLSLPAYDPHLHASIADILSRRLAIAIHYESLYGGEGFRVALKPATRRQRNP
ncbi:hypothetical protein [Streptomyces sp. AM8-1-1]|uniref:hypothetical protein n=1 Tax=Streptomyces sp. AM8-1-1 TaxID=3075825 RepID=UPI0028C47BD0|nr:hypothetical protein [Streptomyces sp. AM8-1-1]WNO76769.1 hypothetical protein RPQ07_36355 [Streptomyces sp. AM8-1-1]